MLLVINRLGQAYKLSMKTVEILSIKKKEIVIRKPKKLKSGMLVLSLIIIALTMAIFSHESMNDIASSMVYVYNPVNSLYSDNSGVVFTGGFIYEKDSLDFNIPIKSGTIQIDEGGTVSLLVGSSIIVKSSEAGVVDEVGISNDGYKYIKIRHTTEVYSIISNLSIVGVSEGQVVKRGEDIAVAKEGEYIYMQILLNGLPVSNLKLNQSKIVWKD